MPMFRSDKKIPDFSGSLVADSDVVFDIPTGPTYQSFQIDTNLEADKVTYELELNGEVIYKLTGTQMDEIDEHLGIDKVSGLFNFRISLDQLHDAENIAYLGLVTLQGDNVFLRAKVSDTAVGSPTMKVYHEANPSRSVRDYIPRMKPVHIPITSTGENEYQWKRQGLFPQNLRLTSIHFNGAVTNVKIEQDDLTQFDMPIKNAHARLTQSACDERAVVSGYYHLDFVRHGYLRDAFDTYSKDKQLLFTLTTSDSNDVTALVHSFEMLNKPVAEAA